MAQTAKRHFLNRLETSSKPWLCLPFCAANCQLARVLLQLAFVVHSKLASNLDFACPSALPTANLLVSSRVLLQLAFVLHSSGPRTLLLGRCFLMPSCPPHVAFCGYKKLAVFFWCFWKTLAVLLLLPLLSPAFLLASRCFLQLQETSWLAVFFCCFSRCFLLPSCCCFWPFLLSLRALAAWFCLIRQLLLSSFLSPGWW